MKRYNELQKEGRIGFCTFHQSMDYEDFVEGIKPKTINEQITYVIEPGIFKTMCENAKSIFTEKKSDKIDFSKTRVFKMSLGEKGKDDTEIFEYCIENNVVGLGWGGDKDFSQCKKREDFKALDDTWGAFAMEVFKQWMEIGDIILISDGTKSVKAIARVLGEYEFRKDTPINMCQFRKVEWLYTGDLIPISRLYDKNLSQQSIYAFYFTPRYGKPDYNGTIKVDVINDIITGKVDDETPQNYVLIIDEINRGNVSKIFGELITLIEADKRIGGDHPIKVTLPYSKELFGVPSNLYIIGTMNTTDRSVGNIDYAVRRRFAFSTLESKMEVIEEHYKNDENLKSKAQVLFNSVKSFLEKHKYEMDIADLMVGHSYFLAKDEEGLDLKWKYEIVPLLREYFKDGIIKQDVKADITIEDFCNNK
jgi:5-methylcytosine-specific restriction protein B